jgi:hypothetical protein
VGDHFGSIVEAGDHGAATKAGEFFVAVADGADPLGALAGVEAKFGGGGTGIDGQDLGAEVRSLGGRRGGDCGLGRVGVRQKATSGADKKHSQQGEPEFISGLEANAGVAVTVLAKWSETGQNGRFLVDRK